MVRVKALCHRTPTRYKNRWQNEDILEEGQHYSVKLVCKHPVLDYSLKKEYYTNNENGFRTGSLHLPVLLRAPATSYQVTTCNRIKTQRGVWIMQKMLKVPRCTISHKVPSSMIFQKIPRVVIQMLDEEGCRGNLLKKSKKMNLKQVLFISTFQRALLTKNQVRNHSALQKI